MTIIECSVVTVAVAATSVYSGASYINFASRDVNEMFSLSLWESGCIVFLYICLYIYYLSKFCITILSLTVGVFDKVVECC